MAWSIDDAPLGPGSRRADRLPAARRPSAASWSGSPGRRSAGARWTTYLLGATFAALARAAHGRRPVLGMPGIGSVRDAAAGYRDGGRLTTPTSTSPSRASHSRRSTATTCWSSARSSGRPGQFAAYAVFGHRRPLNAGDRPRADPAAQQHGPDRPTTSSATYRAVQPRLAVPADPVHAIDEQANWLRRRIGDPAAVGRAVPARRLRCSSAAAVIGSFFLTATASSAPLPGPLGRAPDARSTISPVAPRFLPGRPNPKTRRRRLRRRHDHPVVVQDDSIAFAVQLPPSEDGARSTGVLSRTIEFDLNAWSAARPRTPTKDRAASRPAGRLADDATALPGRRALPCRVTP